MADVTARGAELFPVTLPRLSNITVAFLKAGFDVVVTA